MKQSSFYAMLFRMKYINRWGLMRNTRWENLSEHSLETAMLAHILAVIGNRRLGKNYPLDEIVLHAIYHDCSEILTGDLPTPSTSWRKSSLFSTEKAGFDCFHPPAMVY